jgi:hypothetical protein
VIVPHGILLHGFGIRYDLPVPLSYYVTAAVAVVVLSFVLVAVFLRADGEEHAYPRLRLDTLPVLGPIVRGPALRLVLGAIGVLGLAAIVTTGLFGAPDATDNPAEYLTWVYFWAATVVLSAVLGNLYALLNPWSALYDLAVWLLRRQDAPPLLRYPARLGVWPAAAGYLLFAFFELASGESANPRAVAVAAIGYTVYTLAGMAVFGRDIWLARGEAFSLLFHFIGAFSPVDVRSDDPAACDRCHTYCHPGQQRCVDCGECYRGSSRRSVALRPYAVGLTQLDLLGWDLIVFVALMLSSLAFDGISATPLWAGIYDAALPLADGLGGLAPAAVKGAGLVGVALVFGVVYLLFAQLVRRFGGSEPRLLRVGTLFAYTLIPIALVYFTAHFYTYIVIQSQGLLPLLADPFHTGARLLPTSGYKPSFALADAAVVWYLQVILIVLGHVIAVYLAHMRSLDVFPRARAALRSQLPMLVLMIVYTSVSLWILAQPITESG